MKKINNSECLRSFGKYIKTERTKRRYYQSDVAQLVGISQSYYSLIERGEREVDLVLAINICNTLGLNMQDFISKYL